MIIFGKHRQVDNAVLEAPYRFGVRLLFAWTTVVAVAIAACAGRFGELIQILSVATATLLGACIVITIAMGGPWFMLIWCCQVIVSLIGRARRLLRNGV